MNIKNLSRVLAGAMIGFSFVLTLHSPALAEGDSEDESAAPPSGFQRGTRPSIGRSRAPLLQGGRTPAPAAPAADSGSSSSSSSTAPAVPPRPRRPAPLRPNRPAPTLSGTVTGSVSSEEPPSGTAPIPPPRRPAPPRPPRTIFDSPSSSSSASAARPLGEAAPGLSLLRMVAGDPCNLSKARVPTTSIDQTRSGVEEIDRSLLRRMRRGDEQVFDRGRLGDLVNNPDLFQGAGNTGALTMLCGSLGSETFVSATYSEGKIESLRCRKEHPPRGAELINERSRTVAFALVPGPKEIQLTELLDGIIKPGENILDRQDKSKKASKHIHKISKLVDIEGPAQLERQMRIELEAKKGDYREITARLVRENGLDPSLGDLGKWAALRDVLRAKGVSDRYTDVLKDLSRREDLITKEGDNNKARLQEYTNRLDFVTDPELRNAIRASVEEQLATQSRQRQSSTLALLQDLKKNWGVDLSSDYKKGMTLEEHTAFVGRIDDAYTHVLGEKFGNFSKGRFWSTTPGIDPDVDPRYSGNVRRLLNQIRETNKDESDWARGVLPGFDPTMNRLMGHIQMLRMHKSGTLY